MCVYFLCLTTLLLYKELRAKCLHDLLKPQLKLCTFIAGLSIDYGENKLYWISAGNGTINRCNLDGGNLEIIDSMKEDLTKATALTIMGKSSGNNSAVNCWEAS